MCRGHVVSELLPTLGHNFISLLAIALHFNIWLCHIGDVFGMATTDEIVIIAFNDCFLFITFSASHKQVLAISCTQSFICASLLLTEEKDLLNVSSQSYRSLYFIPLTTNTNPSSDHPFSFSAFTYHLYQLTGCTARGVYFFFSF